MGSKYSCLEQTSVLNIVTINLLVNGKIYNSLTQNLGFNDWVTQTNSLSVLEKSLISITVNSTNPVLLTNFTINFVESDIRPSLCECLN